jgi:hypothetical protein
VVLRREQRQDLTPKPEALRYREQRQDLTPMRAVQAECAFEARLGIVDETTLGQRDRERSVRLRKPPIWDGRALTV